MRIEFLIQNYYGVGGTNTAVHNLALGLAERHEVEVVSVVRRQDHCHQDPAGRYTVRPLLDLRRGRPDATDLRLTERSRLVPPDEEYYGQYNALTDERIVEHLAAGRSDVVIGTRPSLNLLIARHGHPRALRIAQEHMTHDLMAPGVVDALRAAYPGLSASVTLTASEASWLRGLVPGHRVETIPNAVPEAVVAPSTCEQPLVVAAGRLDVVKRYDVLVRAFALVADELPEWTLRIYGDGERRDALRALVARLDLHDRVLLMGRVAPLEVEWVKGSVAASSSTHESFGMTIVEAMRAGLPVVSTDAPVGPREIVSDGENGYLVPVGDVEALADRLRVLMRDTALRQRMGAAAEASSHRFLTPAVVDRYEALFDELAADLPRRPSMRSVRSVLGRLARRREEPVAGPVDASPPKASVVAEHGRLRVHPPAGWTPGSTLLLRSRVDRSRRTYPFTGPPEAPVCEVAEALPDGRWNAYLVEGKEAVRLDAFIDARALLAPPQERGPLSVLLPYRTADGFLAVRSWTRESHVECTGTRFEGSVLVLDLEPHARAWGEDPGVTLRAVRRGAVEVDVEVPLEASGPAGFTGRLPLHDLVDARLSRHDDWDLWVVRRSGAEVRVARFLDDVAERKAVYRHPRLTFHPDEGSALVETHPASTVAVQVYWTVDSEVSVFVAE